MDDAVTLRPMTASDLPLLHAWLHRPHVAAWWGDADAPPSRQQVDADYHPDVLAAEGVTPYVAVWRTRPIGYAQSYVAMGSGDGWWVDETDPGVRGIDQLLGEPALLGRGLGTRLVEALVERLFADAAVTRVQVDPDPRNARAIRCYEKAGFRAVRTIATPDGPALYMVRDRPAR